jgi:hypothetical protein
MALFSDSYEIISCLWVWGGGFSTEVKRSGCEANYSLPPSAKVKDAWSYTSTPPYVFEACCLIKHRTRLHGVVVKQRENFTITLPRLGAT